MKSFKDYLQESKQVYEYKVKIAGDCPKDTQKTLKIALEKFGCTSCSKGNRTPIQESPLDFPEEKFSEVTLFDVSVTYPTTSPLLKEYIASQLKIAGSRVCVLTPFDIKERELNNSTKHSKGEALLGKDYADGEDGQSLVGEKRMGSFLKELSKEKHGGEEYKLPTGK
jgi:hypothetical protein